MDKRMRIGELAKRAGVTQRTVRHYESIGLMPPGERKGTGQHYYTEESLERLRKIDQLKKLGLILDEMREVVQLYFMDLSGVQSKRKALDILRRLPVWNAYCDSQSNVKDFGLTRPHKQYSTMVDHGFFICKRDYNSSDGLFDIKIFN